MSGEQIYWITGASQGLGRYLALHAAGQGHTVVASARGKDKLDELSAEAASLKGQIYGWPLDMTDRNAVGRAVVEMTRQFGGLDVVVLNAGTHKPVDARQLTLEDFQSLIDLNLIGTIHCLESVIPQMVAAGGGRIAVVASLAGYCGLPSAAAYGMTKAGLINLCQTLRGELSLDGVTVQVVNPGFVRTPLTDKNDFDMPFLMEPEDAAKAFYEGLQDDRFEIAFPRRFALVMRVLKNLPDWLFFRLTRGMARKRREAAKQ